MIGRVVLLQRFIVLFCPAFPPRADYTTRLPSGGLEAITKGNRIRISPGAEQEINILIPS